MAEFNRRKFLIAGRHRHRGTAVGAVALTLPDMLDAARDRPLPDGSGILVIVTLYGGNDGINTVIPYTDNAYHDARPELAYQPEEVLPLDGQLGLNPALTGLSEMWKDHQLAIVRGVGYPNPIAATSDRWTSGRRPHRRSRCRPAGSVAGSTSAATIPCVR